MYNKRDVDARPGCSGDVVIPSQEGLNLPPRPAAQISCAICTTTEGHTNAPSRARAYTQGIYVTNDPSGGSGDEDDYDDEKLKHNDSGAEPSVENQYALRVGGGGSDDAGGGRAGPTIGWASV